MSKGQETYHVFKQNGRWRLQKTTDRPGWFGSPILFSEKFSRKGEAVNVARMLAGRTARVSVENRA
jgi:hypothetical protein